MGKSSKLAKGLVVHDGYAEKGEPVVPGVGAGCYGAWSRKLVFEARVVRLEHPVDVIAEETLKAFHEGSIEAGRRFDPAAWDARVAEQAAGIRRLYAQVRGLRVGTRVRLPTDAEDPVVEPMSTRR